MSVNIYYGMLSTSIMDRMIHFKSNPLLLRSLLRVSCISKPTRRLTSNSLSKESIIYAQELVIIIFTFWIALHLSIIQKLQGVREKAFQIVIGKSWLPHFHTNQLEQNFAHTKDYNRESPHYRNTKCDDSNIYIFLILSKK